MRKLFLHMFVTLDGFIEGPNGELDFMAADDEIEEYINRMLGALDQMVFGRKAFELLAQYWPDAEQNPLAAADPARPERHIEAARMMNAKEKIVFSKTLKSTDWANSTIVADDAAEAVGNLKRQPGRDIALFAGANIARSFHGLSLIDEYRLLVHPLILGAGKRLFANGGMRRSLTLSGSRQFGCGAVLLTYRPA